uniref:Uncharacterized protein n=1 Tax=Anguilla anguilla TaxID=7936 RepID=A0A0E9S7P6_ANGAN
MDSVPLICHLLMQLLEKLFFIQEIHGDPILKLAFYSF